MARAGIGPRLLRIVGAVIGALLVLLLGVTLLLQTGPVSRRVKDFVVPRASAALGRELTVRDARLGIFPRPEVVLRGASVAGRPGEPPLVELQSLDVAVEAWPLIRSLGKEVRVAIAAQFTVKDGAMTLAKPLTFGAPFGTANLGGKIGLGGELALQGTADIPKATLQQLAARIVGSSPHERSRLDAAYMSPCRWGSQNGRDPLRAARRDHDPSARLGVGSGVVVSERQT